jgi:hypothetical protein
LHNRFAIAPRRCRHKTETKTVQKREAVLPFFDVFGAGNEIRTRDLNLGKVALYQLSYSRMFPTFGVVRRSQKYSAIFGVLWSDPKNFSSMFHRF